MASEKSSLLALQSDDSFKPHGAVDRPEHRADGDAMSTATLDLSVFAPESIAFSARSAPPLKALFEMVTVPDLRIVIRDVDWAYYERVVDAIPAGRHIHVDYDGNDLEIESPTSARHEDVRTLFGQLVESVAQELGIPYKGVGGTTWQRPKLARGLESDECYYFTARKRTRAAAALARKSMKIADYPNPDLAIEVDISPSRINRPGIYAALRVTEIWRFDGEHVVIERLTKQGTYRPVASSRFLPVRAEEIRRWLVDEDSSDHSSWARRLRAWVRAELLSRLSR
jgi:Uma2 family endonuclease